MSVVLQSVAVNRCGLKGADGVVDGMGDEKKKGIMGNQRLLLYAYGGGGASI